MENATIGSLIAAAAARGIGATRIARLTGMDRTSWHRWETGKARPSTDNLRLVSDALLDESVALAALAQQFARLAECPASDTVTDTVPGTVASVEGRRAHDK